MRAFFLHLLLLTFFSSAICQNSVVSKTSTTSETERWNLDKYVWSHTHYQTGKNDKPVVDFDLIDNWIVLDKNISISRNGKYFAYTTRYTRNKLFAPDSLVIMSTHDPWRKSFAGAKNGFFSGDGSWYIFQNKDKLYFVKTGAGQVQTVEGILSYKCPDGGKTYWVAYQLKDKKVVLKNLLSGKEYPFNAISNYEFSAESSVFTCNNVQKELTVFNLSKDWEKSFPSSIDYKINDKGESLLLKKSAQNGVTELQYISLSNVSTRTLLWSSLNTSTVLQGYSLDHSGKQVLFTVQQKEGDPSTTSIWYWRVGMSKPIEKVNNESIGIDGDLLSKGEPVFSDNEEYIKFVIEEKPEVLTPMPDAVNLNVWSYFDTVLQSTQLSIANNKKKINYKSFIAVDGGEIIRETNHETIKAESADFLLMTKKGSLIRGDRFWEKGYFVDSNFLVSVKDGSRRSLPTTAKGNFWFSPDGKYLVYFDEGQRWYFSYNLQTGEAVNISIGVPPGQLADDTYGTLGLEASLNRPFGQACWQMDDKALWVYDKYDIWSLDLRGKKSAVNITNGFGRKNHIVLRMAGGYSYSIVEPVHVSRKILLKAQNEENKYNGFYSLGLGKASNPSLLYMGPCVLEEVASEFNAGMVPIKAANANTWIVKKQSAIEAPNLFLTKDFKTYKALTNLQLHKKYNWLTAELHQFKQLDGSMGRGVLYKPENFDPLKRYPVIVAFYASLSDRLYIFPEPEYMLSPVVPKDNPGWLVSHGYLVFLPDIDFTKGNWGPCTLNSVEGAARYLEQLPFVDGKAIGAVGHSNSGRFGYYLLTHSHMFKAMSIGSGMGGTDILSLSLSGQAGESALEWAEKGSAGQGLGSLWENKERWLDHTAVLQADKITTPLLLFHCKLDGDDVRLAMELFTAMRRLDKMIWWLEYDEGDHTVWRNLKDKRDFTIRYTQYFDHYLKGAPTPEWMSKGIPAKLKGVEARYKLNKNY